MLRPGVLVFTLTSTFQAIVTLRTLVVSVKVGDLLAREVGRPSAVIPQEATLRLSLSVGLEQGLCCVSFFFCHVLGRKSKPCSRSAAPAQFLVHSLLTPRSLAWKTQGDSRTGPDSAQRFLQCLGNRNMQESWRPQEEQGAAGVGRNVSTNTSQWV